MTHDAQQQEISELKARLEQLEAATRPIVFSAPKKKGGVGRLLLWVGCSMLGLFVLIAIFGSSLASSPCTDYEGAKDYARRFLALLLKYPQTAKFDLKADQLGDCRWHVHGTVSAQNAFGAFLPRDIDMTLKGDSATKEYRVESSNLVADAVDSLK